MVPATSLHFIHRPHHRLRSEEQNETSYSPLRRTSYCSEEMEIEMVRACLKISRACQDSATGYSTR